MKLEQMRDFLTREWRSFITEALAPPVAQTGPDEASLIQRAAAGSRAKLLIEDPVLQEYFARAEAQLTHEMLGLDLNDDTGRRNLAAAINATRGAQRYLVALAQDSLSAERELTRLRDGATRRDFF